ncbi:MAG: hypothetical protein ACYTFK_11990, partial [Planctomycetota bacterium]
MEHPLFQFCTTERQRAAVRLILIEGKSQRKASKEAGYNPYSLKNALQEVKEKAERRGYSPDHDWNHPVPDGHKIKGVSTFYDDMGNPVR